MSFKTQSIAALFVALVIILVVNPKIVNNIHGNILGRLFLVCLVAFISMHNTTLGLLVALVIITALNQFGSFVEGMDNQTPTTIGEDNVTIGDQQVLTKSATKKTISDLKDDLALGIDKEDIKAAIMAKNSKQIPVDTNMNSSASGEVNASTTSMLKPSSASIEGFSSYASFY